MRVVASVVAVVLMGSLGPRANAQFEPVEGWRETAAWTIQQLRARAESGDPSAQNQLGSRYFKGRGVTLDHGEAEKWYRRAADKGYAAAQNNLGLLYSETKGPQGYALSAAWYHTAATNGSDVAEYNLGLVYRYGKGVKRDYELAAHWIEKSASNGYPVAQNAIAHMYRQGIGVPRDTDTAIRWYLLAALQDLSVAQFNLGKLYLIRYVSQPTKENHQQAMEWLTAAAENQNVDAQGTLGSVYQRGHGVTADDPLAWMWYSLAAGNGSEKAQRKLASLEAKMTADELGRGRQLRIEWLQTVGADD